LHFGILTWKAVQTKVFALSGSNTGIGGLFFFFKVKATAYACRFFIGGPLGISTRLTSSNTALSSWALFNASGLQADRLLRARPDAPPWPFQAVSSLTPFVGNTLESHLKNQYT
jgi:hypothetical protein